MEIANTSASSDEVLTRVAATMAEKKRRIRVRVPLQLWDGRNYQSWRERWVLEMADVAEANALKDAMDEFFSAVARVGPVRVMDALKAEQQKREQL